MASMKERLSALVERLRQRYPLVDHAVRLVRHYTNVNGNAQAGAVTYFAFLSFFPLLALAFFVVGQISKVYDAKSELVTAIDQVLPNIVGGGRGEIPLSTFEERAATVGLIGLAGVLYAGLNWLSRMRDSLEVVFELPKVVQPNFVVGKLRDLVSLVVIGTVLILSVSASSLLTWLTEAILEVLRLEDTLVSRGLVSVVSVLLGITATTMLFLVTFRLLVRPEVPRGALVSGAIFGAVAFEVLKQAASLLLEGTRSQPAFQAFGIALILLVWINYFSRIVMLSAAWSYTAPEAVGARAARSQHLPGIALTSRNGTDEGVVEPEAATEGAGSRRGWLAVGGLAAGAAGAALTAVAVRRRG